jgi:hypothetical protein
VLQNNISSDRHKHSGDERIIIIINLPHVPRPVHGTAIGDLYQLPLWIHISYNTYHHRFWNGRRRLSTPAAKRWIIIRVAPPPFPTLTVVSVCARVRNRMYENYFRRVRTPRTQLINLRTGKKCASLHLSIRLSPRARVDKPIDRRENDEPVLCAS